MFSSKCYHVYILASSRNGTLYTGVTNNILRRVYEHKKKIIKGFSSKYNINKLVYFEEFDNINNAISREKQIKKWYRNWKLKTIESFNPEWEDLYYKFGGTDNMFDNYFKEKKAMDSRIRGNDKINGITNKRE